MILTTVAAVTVYKATVTKSNIAAYIVVVYAKEKCLKLKKLRLKTSLNSYIINCTPKIHSASNHKQTGNLHNG